MHSFLHAGICSRHGWLTSIFTPRARYPAPQINSYLHVTGQNRLRQRTYSVHNHVKCVLLAGLELNAS